MTTHERLLRLCSTELDFLLQPAGLKATCSTCAKGVAPWTEIGADPPPRWAFESGGDVDYFVTPWPRDDDPDDWATSSGNVDYTRFYLPLWQNVDAILREMSDRRVLTKILRHIVERGACLESGQATQPQLEASEDDDFALVPARRDALRSWDEALELYTIADRSAWSKHDVGPRPFDPPTPWVPLSAPLCPTPPRPPPGPGWV